MSKYLLTNQNPRYLHKLYISNVFVAAGFGGEEFVPILSLNNDELKAMIPYGYSVICNELGFVIGFEVNHEHENCKKRLINIIPVIM